MEGLLFELKAVINYGFESKKNKLFYSFPFYFVYVNELSTIAGNCGMKIHIYADETNFYLAIAPGS